MKPTNPMRRVDALMNSTKPPGRMRIAALALLGKLADERRNLQSAVDDVNRRLGELSMRWLAIGNSVRQQEADIGITRGALSDWAKNIVRPKRGSAAPLDDGEWGRIHDDMIRLRNERTVMLDALDANSAAMAKLTYWSFNDLGFQLVRLTEATGLVKSTVRLWIRNRGVIMKQYRGRPSAVARSGRKTPRRGAR